MHSKRTFDEIARITGMTLAEAEAFIWTPNNYRRPIGVLLSEGEITLKDMIWAYDNGYVARLRKAARTVLLTHLLGDELEDRQAPLTLIEGDDYSARQERMWLLGSGSVFGISFAISLLGGIVLLIVTFLQASRPELYELFGTGLWLFIGILLGMAFAGTAAAGKLGDRSRNYRKGRQGERSVLDMLLVSLPSPWTIIRNMQWLHRKWGDVDLVLIGPSGIWVIEVKAYTGPVRVSGDRWQYKSRWGWRTIRKNPAMQATRNAVNVKKYLTDTDETMDVGWVNALVVWAGEEDAISVDDPSVPVWKLSELTDELEVFWREQKHNDEQIKQAVSILTTALEKVKAANAAESN